MILNDYNDLLNELKIKCTNHMENFQAKLIPTKTKILGVKMADLKFLAKQLSTDMTFYEKLPSNDYLEVDIIKGLMISYCKLSAIEKLSEFKEFAKTIDNWCVCDTVVCSTKFKEKDHLFLLNYIKDSISTNHEFEVRFGIILLMKYFNNDYDLCFNLIDNLNYGAYYLDMGVAWLISVLLVKHFEESIPYIIKMRCKSEFVYQKSLQKAIESFRITKEQKESLRLLKKECVKC